MGFDLMKKLLALVMLFALSAEAFADGNSLVIIKRRPDDSGMDQIVVAAPTVSSILYQDTADFKPRLLSLGSNLDLSSGVLSVTGMPAAQIQADWNQSNTSALDYVKNKPTIPLAQVQSDWNAVSGLGVILNKPTIPSIPTRSQSVAVRSLNSAFQINASRDAIVSYSVRITTTVSIGSNQDGDVILEIASDSAFTSNVQIISVGENGQTITLAIALNSVQAQTIVLNGFVPAGYYVRLRTSNNTGTPTYAYRAGQETLL